MEAPTYSLAELKEIFNVCYTDFENFAQVFGVVSDEIERYPEDVRYFIIQTMLHVQPFIVKHKKPETFDPTQAHVQQN